MWSKCWWKWANLHMLKALHVVLSQFIMAERPWLGLGSEYMTAMLNKLQSVTPSFCSNAELLWLAGQVSCRLKAILIIEGMWLTLAWHLPIIVSSLGCHLCPSANCNESKWNRTKQIRWDKNKLIGKRGSQWDENKLVGARTSQVGIKQVEQVIWSVLHVDRLSESNADIHKYCGHTTYNHAHI